MLSTVKAYLLKKIKCYDAPMTKEEKLDLLKKAVEKSYPDKKLVFHDGSPDAKVMLIGEAPGKDEEKQGVPFIGRGGRLLMETLAELGYKRSDFYISNIVKYRPQTPEGATLTPSDKEIAIFKPLIEKEISVVEPKIVVVLGRIAMMGLGISGMISQNHGKILEHEMRKILVAYHPAAILRNMNLLSIFRNDLSKIADYVNKKSA